MGGTDAPKLTKKQRKSAAFRERKRKDVRDVPEQDGGDGDADGWVDDEPVAPLISEPKSKSKPDKKGKAKAKPDTEPEVQAEAVPAPAPAPAKTVKRKRSAAQIDADTEGGPAAAPPNAPAKPKKKRKVAAPAEGEASEPDTRRKILFLGNLKYTTTKEEIAKHFAACDPPPTIRLLTPKPKPGAPPLARAIKSKGCAFLEFASGPALQEGLRLHHSVLDGRQVNVELTAGGGGNSDARLTKLKTRNKELATRRDKAAEKRKDAPDPDLAALLAGKRYSATSGVAQAPTKTRTWTVGDTVDDTTHRGGVKHAKPARTRGARVKAHVSGMNAIPVG